MTSASLVFPLTEIRKGITQWKEGQELGQWEMPKPSPFSKSGSLCTIAWDYKNIVKYTGINCGDLVFSSSRRCQWKSAPVYLTVEILSHMAAYLKCAWPKACYKTVGWTLPTARWKMSRFQVTQCVYVWGLLYLLLWADVPRNAFLRPWADQEKVCIWGRKAVYTQYDHSWRNFTAGLGILGTFLFKVFSS